VQDYWIVNPVKQLLEARRQPVARPSAPYGWHYRAVQMLGPSSLVSPIAARRVRIRVADLIR